MPSNPECEEGELNPVRVTATTREERGNKRFPNPQGGGGGVQAGDSATGVAESAAP